MGTAFFFLTLILLSVEKTGAQPGPRPEEIAQKIQQLKDEIEETDKQLNSTYNPPVYLYERRGTLYTSLYRMSQDRTDRTLYAERAFADLSRAIELEPYPQLFVERAGLHNMLWRDQVSGLSGMQTEEMIERFFRSPYFDGVVADYLEAVRRMRQWGESYSDKTYPESRAKEYLTQLSYLYLYRAQVLARMPELLNETRGIYSVWDDFDKAIEYAKKTVDPASDLSSLPTLFMHKGDAASELGEYQIAIEAYQGGENYFSENYKFYCKNRGEDNCKYTKKNFLDMFSMRRARIYLKTGEAAKAVTDLNYYIDNSTTHPPCPQPYLMRAQAYRRLGNKELALADELTASKLENRTGCGY